MLDAIERAVRITSGSYEEFKSDELKILSVMMCINILGDAANKIPDEIRTRHPEVPWDKVRGIRNQVAHEYFKVDESILWNTCRTHLPIVKKQIEQMLDKDLGD
jgi:uncharacterized protein with HEPN domain